MEYSRGSEWRRWDLHVHTPYTLKCDNFSGSNPEEKWKSYFDTILAYVGDMTDPQKAVSVIGITDYLSIENYKKVISNDEIMNKFHLVLPNIELRLLPTSSKSALNIHCIFNPALSPQEIEDRFLSQLTFSKDKQIYTATPNGLMRLGRAIENNNTLDDYYAMQIGASQFVIGIDVLKKVFINDSNLRENTFIVVPNSQNDGASGLANPSLDNSKADSSLMTVRQEIYKFADAIFSGNPSDRLYFLGKGSASIDAIKQNCGKLMPCIHGSDAHENSKIFEPDQKRYCWIKADCSFYGLKQIIYEPETRVLISETKPEEKKPYYVIDQVIISDESFSSSPIKFSENLTCIIGGKSTGKSVLLNNIAATIDSTQVDDKNFAIYGSKSHRSLSYPLPKMEVKWKDGAISTRTANTADRKIVYIPQTYLNRLADESTEKNDIDIIIEDVLLLNKNIKTANDVCKKKITETKMLIDKKIYDIVSNRGKVAEIKAEISERGVLKSIENEIKRLRQKKQELSKQASISDMEMQEYEDAISKNKEIDKQTTSIEHYQKFLNETESLLEKIDVDPFLDDAYIQQLQTEIEGEYAEALKSWRAFKKAKSDELIKQVELLKEKKLENSKKIMSLQQRLADTETAQKLNNDIEAEERKKYEIEQYNKQKEILDKQYNDDIEDLVCKSISFETIYNEYASKVNDETGLSNTGGGTLQFISSSVFRGDFFFSEFSRILDNRKLKTKFITDDNSSQYNDFDAKLRMQLLDAVFLTGAANILKKNITIEEALRIIFSDFFTINYTVSVDGDTIKEMSPGKKALVLLKLLINLAETNCPILIDQPEDDLDNRSIYYDLATFIREKKSARQIILVTHNANIVLGCDAEEVIVANQHGVNAQNNRFRFEYRSGAIENNSTKRDRNGKIMQGILNAKGIQDHICEVLEGGKEAFIARKNKYYLVKE